MLTVVFSDVIIGNHSGFGIFATTLHIDPHEQHTSMMLNIVIMVVLGAMFSIIASKHIPLTTRIPVIESH